jgi:hypothetical protein
MPVHEPRIVFLHWKREEIRELASRILGCAIACYVPIAGEGMKGLKEYPIPDALVIALDRMPSHGRDIGYAFHRQKSTRQVPLVYVGGDPAKVEKIRELLPESTFTDWDRVSEAIRGAIANPAMVLPRPGGEISTAPVYRKIGLEQGMRIALLGAPAPLEDLAPGLPSGIAIDEEPSIQTAMTLWFVRSEEEFAGGLPEIAPALGKKPRLWVFYQRGKGLTWTRMLEAAAAYELAQFKIMRLNERWSGVGFGRSRGSA